MEVTSFMEDQKRESGILSNHNDLVITYAELPEYWSTSLISLSKS